MFSVTLRYTVYWSAAWARSNLVSNKTQINIGIRSKPNKDKKMRLGLLTSSTNENYHCHLTDSVHSNWRTDTYFFHVTATLNELGH